MPHELLEDLTAGRERFRRGLRGLEICTFCGDRPARGRDLRGFVGVQVGRRLATVLAARAAVGTRWAAAIGPVVAARTTV
jgi:hypothetical protein